MTTSTAGPALRRYATATWRPALILLATATTAAGWHGQPLTADATAADQAATTRALAALLLIIGAASLTRLAVTVSRLTRQPARDEQAHAQLDGMRMAASRADCQVLEVHRIQWATSAGQRAWAIDTATGGIGDHWFPDRAHLPQGAFVLLRQTPDRPPEILAWLPPEAIQAAARHGSREAQRRKLLEQKNRQARGRREKAAARQLVEEAEQITRSQ